MVLFPRGQSGHKVSNVTTSLLWWKSNRILSYNEMKILFWEMFFKGDIYITRWTRPLVMSDFQKGL
jgi:hypothetical protein